MCHRLTSSRPMRAETMMSRWLDRGMLRMSSKTKVATLPNILGTTMSHFVSTKTSQKILEKH